MIPILKDSAASLMAVLNDNADTGNNIDVSK